MSKFLNTVIAAMLLATPVAAEKLGLGRAALPEEIAAWDLDISPDGTGLPVGSGSVLDGEEIFSANCAMCHGEFAEGVDNWPKLAGGMDTLDHDDPLKTVGSYWPHLSTAFDYIRRSMPFGNAQSLTDDEVYAIVAYILYSNDLVDEDFELSNENFLEVEMPNADGFFVDNRDETEYGAFNDTCMTDCKDTVEITMRAAVLDVTPEEEGADQAPAQETAAASEAPAPVEQAAPAAAAFDAAMAEDGEKVFKKCKACHQLGDGAVNKTGPVLNGIVGSAIGANADFKYSKTLSSMNADGMVWDDATLAEFLAAPKKFAKGTKMSFAGLKKDDDIKNVIEYLKSHQ
jgi:cytochrome c2